jgi:hypothetical protein
MHGSRNSSGAFGLFSMGLMALAVSCGSQPPPDSTGLAARSEISEHAACAAGCATANGESMGSCLETGDPAQECAARMREALVACLDACGRGGPATAPAPEGPPAGVPPAETPPADRPPVDTPEPPAEPPTPPAEPPAPEPPATPASPDAPPFCAAGCDAIAAEMMSECLSRGGSAALCERLSTAARDACTRACAH